MSDLVEYLRNAVRNPVMGVVSVPAEKLIEAADRIEQLERELAEAREIVRKQGRELGNLDAQLTAEKALADQVYEALYFDRAIDRQLALRAYRKARGL